MDITIVIPAYNEETRIKNTVEKITSFLKHKGLSSEIIIVDDGSTDKTVEIIASLKNNSIKIVHNDKNKGKGYAVKRGVLQGQGDWIFFTDADLSTPIEELDNFLKFSGYDVIIGSRALTSSRILVHQPKVRELGGKLINRCVQLIALKGIKDTQCGFKLIRRDAARKIMTHETINGFGFDVEVLFLARKYGYKVLELPVTWSNNPKSTVRPLYDGLRMFFDLIKIRLNDAFKKYD